VKPLVQEFGTNTTPFCPAHSGNAPCSGAPNDYGTIDRVPSHFSNGGYGNYAPGTPALTGDWMAIVSDTGDGNQGAGCPGTTATSNPGEACTGPYALFGTGKATLGYVINFGHNSPGSCEGAPVITKDGWYRFVFVFSDTDGYAYLTESVRSEATGRQVAISGPEPVGGGSPEKISSWGGPGYFWLPTEDYSGLPLANFALQLGQHSQGHPLAARVNLR
jgi:hypothetical protein